MQVASKRLLTNIFRTPDFQPYKSSFIVIADCLVFLPCYCSSEHKSAVVLWYSYIAATRYRTTSRHVSEERNEERTKISGERGGLGQEEGEKRSVDERHRRSEGGLSVLFARRAVIEYRYSQSHGACRRADAKINEPITEVDSRLLCLCVRHASAAYMCAAC